VDHGIEVLLQVDSLAEAVGGHEHALGGVGELKHTLLTVGGRQLAGHRLNGDTLQLLAQLLGQVARRGDEAAEDDGVVVVVEDELLEQLDEALELLVLGATQVIGGLGHGEQLFAGCRLGAVLLGLAAGGGIDGLECLVALLIHDDATADLVGGFARFNALLVCAIAQGHGRRGRAGSERTKQAERRPPPDSLALGAVVGVADGLASEGKDALEQRAVLGREFVGVFLLFAIGKGRDGVEVQFEIAPAALDHVLRQLAALSLVRLAGQGVRQGGEFRAQ